MKKVLPSRDIEGHPSVEAVLKFGCAPGATAFKAGLLAIPTVANAARLVDRRFTETRAASRLHAGRLADAATDGAQGQFYAMVRDGLGA